jgi:adenylyltransferase/sulfurtransferase
MAGGHPLLEEVNPAELALELDGPTPPLLVDVRTAEERVIATIEPSLHLDLGEFVDRAPSEIAKHAEVVIYCHSGMRSAQAAMWLKVNGWSRPRSLAGGIDEWSLVVDPRIPRY